MTGPQSRYGSLGRRPAPWRCKNQLETVFLYGLTEDAAVVGVILRVAVFGDIAEPAPLRLDQIWHVNPILRSPIRIFDESPILNPSSPPTTDVRDGVAYILESPVFPVGKCDKHRAITFGEETRFQLFDGGLDGLPLAPTHGVLLRNTFTEERPMWFGPHPLCGECHQ